MSQAVSSAAKSSMDFLSKKMGLTGIFIGYVFYMSSGPEKLRVILAASALVLYLISQKIGDIVDILNNPKSFDTAGFMDRMSKTLGMTGGFLTALFTANFSPELQLWAGFTVTVTYLVTQGAYDGVKNYYGIGKKIQVSSSGSFARPVPQVDPAQ